MSRKRYQEGSLKKVASRGTWVGQWWEDGTRRNKVLGRFSSMTKSQAKAELDKIMAGVNADWDEDRPEQMLFGSFLERVYFPFYTTQKWKRSTAECNLGRIRFHLGTPFQDRELPSFRRDELQGYLNAKAEAGLSYSVVAHLRWDLNQVFSFAVSEGLIERNPADKLCIPREAKTPERRYMNYEEVQKCFEIFDPRERLMVKFAVFAGMRPGEILALQWRHLVGDGALIQQRLYRGHIDTPKSRKSARTARRSTTRKKVGRSSPPTSSSSD